MRVRALWLWIVAVVAVGGGTLAVRPPDTEPHLAVRMRPAPTTATEEPGAPSTAIDPTPSTSTVVVTTSVPGATAPRARSTATTSRARSTSTTAAPATAAKVAPTPATISQPGVYAVHRDGTGLRRVEATCGETEERRWLDDSTLLVLRAGTTVPVRLGLDGSSTPAPLPSVTGPFGDQVPITHLGSLSPDRRRMAVAFGGDGYGVAVVDLVQGTASLLVSGDNPTPTWSPAGELLLVGPDEATLGGPAGTIRTMSPSPLAMLPPFLSWSPDGRQILGPPSIMDLNRWVVVDPRSGTSRPVPQVGGGHDLVLWAGAGRLVIADPGEDHVTPASLHVLDLGSGKVSDLAEGGWFPSAPADGQVVAFTHRPDESKLDVVRIDGSGRSTLVQTASGLRSSIHSWSPSGAWVLVDACPAGGRSSGLPTT